MALSSRSRILVPPGILSATPVIPRLLYSDGVTSTLTRLQMPLSENRPAKAPNSPTAHRTRTLTIAIPDATLREATATGH